MIKCRLRSYDNIIGITLPWNDWGGNDFNDYSIFWINQNSTYLN